MNKKAALLVGMNSNRGNYSFRGQALPLPELKGCTNDVAGMSGLLTAQYGFDAANIRVLMGRKANKKAILDLLTQLVTGATPGDQLLFYFSGHGGQYCSQPSADFQKCDGVVLDVLCPYGTDWDNQIFVSNQDLKGIVDMLPACTTLEMVLDACTAGGMNYDARTYGETLPRPVVEMQLDSNPGAPPAAPSQSPAPAVAHNIGRALTDTTFLQSLGSPGPKRCIVWASSASDQSSYEYTSDDGKRHGIFTYFLCQTLAKDPKAGRGSVLDKVTSLLSPQNTPRQQQIPALFPGDAFIRSDGFLVPGSFADAPVSGPTS
jgi:hypothetical protein